MKPSNTQVAVAHRRKHSHRNWEDYYEIDFIDTATGALRKTYVSDNNRNFAMWQHLLAYMDDYPQYAICVEGNFRCVKGKEDVLNADTKLAHVRDFNRDLFMQEVYKAYYA